MFGLRTGEDQESCTLGFIMATLEILLGRKKKRFTEEIHSAVTFSKIKLDI